MNRTAGRMRDVFRKNRAGRGLCLLLLLTAALLLSAPAYAEAAAQRSWSGDAALREIGEGMRLTATTGKWKKSKGKRYYRYADGTRATGSKKIKSTYYIFDEKGWLIRPKKISLVTVDEKVYGVAPNGTAARGWHVIGKKLYYVNQNGTLKRNQKFQDIKLKDDGSAAAGQYTTWQKKVSAIVDRITDCDMTKSEKLRACWNYITSRSRFSYRITDPNMKKHGWWKKSAYDILCRESGDCYSFACAFAAMANDIGYNSYVVYGRVSGSRDHAADGLTRHAWVEIGGRYYDPEGHFARWYKNCYGDYDYAIRHQVLKVIRYKDGKVK